MPDNFIENTIPFPRDFMCSINLTSIINNQHEHVTNETERKRVCSFLIDVLDQGN